MAMSKSGQVGIASDHFRNKSRSIDRRATGLRGVFLVLRIRHCVECPKCLTWYLIAFSPYSNGSYLVPTVYGSSEEYILYCCCRGLPVVSPWILGETKACEVMQEAYSRGYGTPEEIFPLTSQPPWSYDISRYLHSKPRQKKRHPS
jgi:hypothetical protein